MGCKDGTIKTSESSAPICATGRSPVRSICATTGALAAPILFCSGSDFAFADDRFVCATDECGVYLRAIDARGPPLVLQPPTKGSSPPALHDIRTGVHLTLFRPPSSSGSLRD